jgi:hypothetical protein
MQMFQKLLQTAILLMQLIFNLHVSLPSLKIIMERYAISSPQISLDLQATNNLD